MNRRQARQFSLDWKKAHSKYERRLYGYFKKALDDQIKDVVKSVRLSGVVGLSLFLNQLVSPERMLRAYRLSYEYVGVQHGKFTTDFMNQLESEAKSRFTTKEIFFGSEFWRNQMREFLLVFGAEKVAEVNETTIEFIRGVLEKSAAENLTISEQATALVEKLNDPKYSRNRALRIARTEATISSNYVAKKAGEEASYQVEKVWISTLDGRTRPNHFAANLQAVPLDEKFNVGGEMMDRPGDPDASASEIVNCRCSIAIRPLIGSNGLPIPK